MILLILLLFLLLKVEFLAGSIEHQDVDGSKQEYPPVPVRAKRDLMSMVVCPRGAASDDHFGQNSEIILYSTTGDKRDNIITYGNDGWSGEKMKSLTGSGRFNASRPTMLFVHGFHQSAWSPWLMDVRSIYDDDDDAETIINSNNNDDDTGKGEASFNLIFFDWSCYPKYRYWASVGYMPYLGKILGEFLYQLSNLYEESSYDMEKVHLIGYSLSTHIVGLAGRYLRSNYGITIGQLTALDPTGVCFHDEHSEFGDENALRSSDAKLVVARHYNMDGLGAKRLIGGLDILVNGGIDQPRDDQDFPGAKHIHDTSIIVMAQQDHHRATEHETHAASDEGQDCHEIAYECDNYEAYLRGECADCGPDGGKCFLVNNFRRQTGSSDEGGMLKKYAPGTRMFLKTHYQEPYCLHHYQLVVHLTSNVSSEIVTLLSSGLIGLDFGGGHEAQFRGNPNSSDGRFTTLASSERKIQSPEGIMMRVQADNATTKALFNSLDYIEMNYMSNLSPTERAKASFKLCPSYNNKSLMKCRA